jgi:hypothetical protein
MRRIMDPSRSQRQVVTQDQATLDRSLARSIIHRTSLAGLIGLAYGICTGVILTAYHEFGSPSLLKPSRFVAADPQPAQLLPQEVMLDDTAAAAWQEAPMTERADAFPLTSPPGNAALTSPVGEIRPAMGGRPAAEPVSEIEVSAAPEAPDSARDAAEPGSSGDEPMPEERLTAAAPETLERSVAAVPEMASELDAAVLPHPAPAVTQVPGTAAALPPTPAFKPLALLPAVVAEAGPAAVLGASGASRGSFGRSRAPKPSMKPVGVASAALPEAARAHPVRAVASKGQTLPDALRAFFTNLKILLASAPAASEFRAGSGGNGGAAIGPGRRGGSGDDSSPSGGGSANPGGGSVGAGAGTGGVGGGGGSASGGGGSASSGDNGGSVSSGGSRGHGRSDAGSGRGGRGDRDRDDDDRGSRGDDRGRGDGDRGGRGNGRGGDDDDD